MKAMILAAGRGERLRPLTDQVPKPLIKISGKCLLDYHLERLAACGIEHVIINVAHLAEKIQAHVGDGSRYGLQVQFSLELDGVLGTGGGVFKALPLLGADPFILLSADIWTDYPLAALPQQLTGLVHLVMLPTTGNYAGDFALQDGRLYETGSSLLTYGGIGVLSPRLFRGCIPGNFSINPLLRRAIQAIQATGEIYNGRLINVTSLTQLVELGLV